MNDSNQTAGQIITFYSYKGGTGRSMALANIACLLGRRVARTSKRILVMDWDLEAPGLHRFFSARCELPQYREQEGLTNYFHSLLSALQDSPGLFESLVSPGGCRILDKVLPLDRYITPDVVPGVDFMRAGLFNADYARLASSFNWVEFYSKYGAVIRAFREMLAEKYSYVLIDSRTGITDISGICTTLLPEKLVGVFVPNKQSLEGLADIVKQAIDYRSKADDFRPLAVFPLPSRIENAEKDLKDQWRESYQKEFEDLFRTEYQLEQCDLGNYFNDVLLSQTSYYAYGENIAVLDNRLQDAASLAKAYERFFDRLINFDTPWELPEPQPRAAGVAALEAPSRVSEPMYDAFLSYAPADKAAVMKIESGLRDLGVRSFLDTRDLLPGEERAPAISHAMAASSTVLVFLGPSGVLPWSDQQALTELEAFGKQADRRIIPVALPGTSLHNLRLPPFLMTRNWVEIRSLHDDDAVQRIARSIQVGSFGEQRLEAVLKARQRRRFLYRTAIVVPIFAALLLLCVFLAISYSNNAGLEHRIQSAAGALPAPDATAIALPTLSDLAVLDGLRKVIAQLDDYHRNGAPLSYRFGLYKGDKLADDARRIYFDSFRPMMLNPAQANFVAFMGALPDKPASPGDFTSYTVAYNPLKAYLITTSNPAKSQPTFLTPIFLQYWIGTRHLDATQQALAKEQIDFYGNELLRQRPPYAINPDTFVVTHARAYLSNFLDETRVYQAMLTDADRTSPPIDFNRLYPGSASFVVETHVVRGAFSKDGFAFMQDAVQHPDKYATGETWVLGAQAGQNLSASANSKDLGALYAADFVKEWRAYMTSARVVGCSNLKDASMRLNKLAEPASPLLAFFSVVSYNTAVNDQQIKRIFQPIQVFVDPNATDKLIGAGNNQGYFTALGALAGAIDLAMENPAITTDPAAFVPVAQELTPAREAVGASSKDFNVDPEMGIEKMVVALMQAPIDCVARLAPSPGGASNGGGAKLCASISPLLAKYPFSSNSTVMASLPEVDTVFAPETGVLWSTYNSILKTVLVQQGAQFVPAPTAPGPVNPSFLRFFNHAAKITSTLYPPGQKQASFTFNLRFIPGGGVSDATFVVDGQRIPAGSNSQQFTWNGASAQSASLVADNVTSPHHSGTWSVFQLVRDARISRTAGGYRLDYSINNGITTQSRAASGQTGGAKTARFELSGPGADFLAGGDFSGLNCVVPVILN